MIAITSISPKHYHADIQKICADSWKEHGLKAFSFNSPNEAAQLKEQYPDVTFVPTYRTMQHKWGRPYVQINAMLDWAKDMEEDILLLNSDILLHNANDALKRGNMLASGGLAYAHRVDIKSLDNKNGQPMVWGLDVFFLANKHLHIFPQTMYCMGQTFWDFWVPYTVSKAGLEIHELKEPFAYHLEHPTQWSMDSWHKMGEYTIWDTGIPGRIKFTPIQTRRNVELVSSKIYSTFKNKS